MTESVPVNMPLNLSVGSNVPVRLPGPPNHRSPRETIIYPTFQLSNLVG